MPVRATGKLSVAIKEQIRAVQYDQPEIADSWEVFGTVQCKVSHNNVTGSLEYLVIQSP